MFNKISKFIHNLWNLLCYKLHIKQIPNVSNPYRNVDFEELNNRSEAIRKLYAQNQQKESENNTDKIVCCKCGATGDEDQFTYDLDENGYLCNKCWNNK